MDYQELKIDDLPPDILTGEYDFIKQYPKKELYKTRPENRVDMLIDLVNGHSVQYKKGETNERI